MKGLIPLRLIASAVAAGLLLAAGSAGAPGAPERPRAWKPSMYAAVKYASHRRGIVAFAIRTRTRSWGWHRTAGFPSASVVKAMLLVAYLNESSVRARPLRWADRALLGPMITRSDNDAATQVLAVVGSAGLRLVAFRSNMRRFTPVEGVWGTSRIDAADQARFFIRIDRLVPRRHRRYAMHLLESIVSYQRWGIARVRPAGWRLYFKGGWGSGIGGIEHQVALLTRRHQRVSVAILTEYNGSHAYGAETLRGVAARLLHGLATARSVP